jgi:hypothetical protein
MQPLKMRVNLTPQPRLPKKKAHNEYHVVPMKTAYGLSLCVAVAERATTAQALLLSAIDRQQAICHNSRIYEFAAGKEQCHYGDQTRPKP